MKMIIIWMVMMIIIIIIIIHLVIYTERYTISSPFYRLSILPSLLSSLPTPLSASLFPFFTLPSILSQSSSWLTLIFFPSSFFPLDAASKCWHNTSWCFGRLIEASASHLRSFSSTSCLPHPHSRRRPSRFLLFHFYRLSLLLCSLLFLLIFLFLLFLFFVFIYIILFFHFIFLLVLCLLVLLFLILIWFFKIYRKSRQHPLFEIVWTRNTAAS